eukprot:scaffold40503_cov40-Phaeocystis_antarctica.AAC.2
MPRTAGCRLGGAPRRGRHRNELLARCADGGRADDGLRGARSPRRRRRRTAGLPAAPPAIRPRRRLVHGRRSPGRLTLASHARTARHPRGAAGLAGCAAADTRRLPRAGAYAHIARAWHVHGAYTWYAFALHAHAHAHDMLTCTCTCGALERCNTST